MSCSLCHLTAHPQWTGLECSADIGHVSSMPLSKVNRLLHCAGDCLPSPFWPSGWWSANSSGRLLSLRWCWRLGPPEWLAGSYHSTSVHLLGCIPCAVQRWQLRYLQCRKRDVWTQLQFLSGQLWELECERPV